MGLGTEEKAHSLQPDWKKGGTKRGLSNSVIPNLPNVTQVSLGLHDKGSCGERQSTFWDTPTHWEPELWKGNNFLLIAGCGAFLSD